MKLSDAQKLLDTQKMMFRINGREEMAVAIETVLQELEKIQKEDTDYCHTIYRQGANEERIKWRVCIKRKIEELEQKIQEIYKRIEKTKTKIGERVLWDKSVKLQAQVIVLEELLKGE